MNYKSASPVSGMLQELSQHWNNISFILMLASILNPLAVRLGPLFLLALAFSVVILWAVSTCHTPSEENWTDASMNCFLWATVPPDLCFWFCLIFHISCYQNVPPFLMCLLVSWELSWGFSQWHKLPLAFWIFWRSSVGQIALRYCTEKEGSLCTAE